MCGICGVIALGRPPESATVEAMSGALAHRGPDAAGLVEDEAGIALGARRLAILDLSDAGRQPFASEDGRLQLVHNGEIYNYRELRAELEAKGHRFRSATDTEVVLAAYREWGDACVERFNGMWAFALWDAGRRRLFCSRDRFGVKPFYYRYARGRFVFASEPKAFAAAREPLRANTRAVRDYLEQGDVDHTGETFFAGIERLPPAHSLVVDRDGLQLRRYWRLEPGEPPHEDPADAVRSLFLDSVRLRLRSDVPVGTALSGGIDSSAIAVAVRQTAERGRQATVTAYFDEPALDERSFARAVVDATGAEPHWVTISDRELVDTLPAVVEAQDEPFGSTSIAAQWHVMRTAREAGLTVMLDGQGGDEVLAGYRAAYGYRLADLLAARRFRELREELVAFRGRHGANRLVAAGTLVRPFVPRRLEAVAKARLKGSTALLHPDLSAAASEDDGVTAPFPDRLRRHLAGVLTRRGLPELLRYEDRNSMAHSVEARVPFLDYRLVELLYSLPGEELIRRGRTKDVLRRALADLLPPAVRDREDKVGFVTPEARWLRGELGTLAADVFASRPFAERGFVNALAARRRLERHRRGEHEAGRELWRALNLELWARRFLDP